jgi:hypothetical protein
VLGRRATLDVRFVEDMLRDRVRRSVETTLGHGRSAIERAMQFGLVATDQAPSMRIAMIVRLPMSVQRHPLSRTELTRRS